MPATTTSAAFDRLHARFPRKRAFITGAANGLGLALVRLLASEGWTLGLFDRNVERLAELETDLSVAGYPILAYPGDVTQADELTVAVNSFAGSHDGLDLMINCAGVSAGGGIMDISVEDWRWIIDINFMGVVHGCRAAVPHLQRNATGLMINIASGAAFAAAPGMSSYNATKAAVLSLSETLAAELRPTGIQVSVVMPGFFKTGLLESFRGTDAAREHAQRLLEASAYTASEAARDLLRMAGNGRMHIVLPQSMRCLWWLKRWLPAVFIRYLARRLTRSVGRAGPPPSNER
jgi:NAD(P)-dependent dehydrogenase (short-subunit alcohol dehydrogenase family)